MTKVTVFGQAQGAEPEKKKIEFVFQVYSDHVSQEIVKQPHQFENIVLLRRDYGDDDFDCFFAYGNSPELGCVFFGHFNDGVV